MPSSGSTPSREAIRRVMASLAAALASRDADAIADALDESAGLSDETVHDLRAAAREVMRRMRVERDASADLRLALARGDRDDIIAALARVEQVGPHTWMNIQSPQHIL